MLGMGLVVLRLLESYHLRCVHKEDTKLTSKRDQRQCLREIRITKGGI